MVQTQDFAIVEMQDFASLPNPVGMSDYRKSRKKPFNPEGVTWDICTEMHPFRLELRYVQSHIGDYYSLTA
ncbi:MAG: hypothetical protein L3J17_04320 [Candidatus Jettenia sp.]|nr:MAG: hypothetical protein L3J17_04320 [Candidatus Jettenia sp.]